MRLLCTRGTTISFGVNKVLSYLILTYSDSLVMFAKPRGGDITSKRRTHWPISSRKSRKSGNGASPEMVQQWQQCSSALETRVDRHGDIKLTEANIKLMNCKKSPSDGCHPRCSGRVAVHLSSHVKRKVKTGTTAVMSLPFICCCLWDKVISTNAARKRWRYTKGMSPKKCFPVEFFLKIFTLKGVFSRKPRPKNLFACKQKAKPPRKKTYVSKNMSGQGLRVFDHMIRLRRSAALSCLISTHSEVKGTK